VFRQPAEGRRYRKREKVTGKGKRWEKVRKSGEKVTFLIAPRAIRNVTFLSPFLGYLKAYEITQDELVRSAEEGSEKVRQGGN
jgi:hypothetical protein